MSDSVRPHRRQPTRLPRPWDSPGKNTGVGCHFLLQCRRVKSESEVAQSCPALSDPKDCGLPGSSFHGIFQARLPRHSHIAVQELPLEKEMAPHSSILATSSLYLWLLLGPYSFYSLLCPLLHDNAISNFLEEISSLY